MTANSGTVATDRSVLGRATRLWQKAQGKDPRYLAWKAADRLAKKTRKYTRRLPGRTLPDGQVWQALGLARDEPLRAHLLGRSQPHFFFAQDEVPALLTRLQAQETTYRRDLLARAEGICRHHLDILAAGARDLGDPIDWHRDYRSGLRWENRFAFDYDFLDLDRPSDVRIVWELNRLHFLVDLGKAYRLSGDARYVQKIENLVAAWDEANPYEFSINWTCAMEAAIRAVNLIWTLVLVLPAPELEDRFLARVLRMLLQHGRYIRHNLEYSDLRGNHYLADLVGLLYLGLFLPESREARSWLQFALPRFEQEIQHQTYPDGVDHEGSIPYHRLVTELFMAPALLLKRNGHPLAPAFHRRLEQMLEFVQAYTKPDGCCPLFGDADDGRLHVLGTQRINDHRFLLSTGAVLFGRADFKAAAGRFWEESAWLTGPEGWATFDALDAGPAAAQSQAFPEGGFFILRQADDYVCIDCGDVGQRGRGGHGHCDILSVEVALAGESVVVDRGSGLYTASRKQRAEVIRAASHNTILVDGLDYARVLGYDIASVQNTRGKVLSWVAGDRGGCFEGEHYGYGDRDPAIVHRRRVELGGAGPRLRLTDSLLGTGEHTVVARFYLAPGCSVQLDETGGMVRTPGGRLLRVRAASSTAGSWTALPASVFPRYGRETSTTLLEWQARLLFPAQVEFCWDLQD